MKVLYEDKDQIAVHKPAGKATQTARLGEKDLVSEVKNYIYQKEGRQNPFVGVINRLDQPVEGIVLFAKNQKAAAQLSKQIQNGCMQKYYRAVLFGLMQEPQGELVDYLWKDGRSNLSKVVAENVKDAKKAVLKYEVKATAGNLQAVDIKLITGRHHQIRVQFATRNHPLIGDLKYGSTESISFSTRREKKELALCAYKLCWKHPVTEKELMICVEPENELIKEVYNS